MRVRNIKRFLKEFGTHCDEQDAKDTPVPESGMIGVVLHNPVRQDDLDRLERLLAHVDLGEAELDIHHVARKIFVGAYAPNRRSVRQVS